MFIYIIKEDILNTYRLPLEIAGSYWFTDIDINNNKRNLINFEEKDGVWCLTCNYDFDLYSNGEIVDEIMVNDDCFYFLKNKFSGEIISLFCSKNDNFSEYLVNDGNDVIVGSSTQCNIMYNNTLIASQQFKLTYSQGIWSITILDNKSKTFVDGFETKSGIIKHGSVIFAMGLKIILIGNKLIANNPANSVVINLPANNLAEEEYTKEAIDDDSNMVVYNRSDYFNRAPRFRSRFEKLQIRIDPPPNKEADDNMSVILTVGPMLTMGVTSVVTIYTGISRAISNNAIGQSIPSLITGLVMLCSMIVWPTLRQNYDERKKIKNEIKRRDKYELYIQKKRQEVVNNITLQRQVLLENFQSLEQNAEVILNKSSKLWDRKIDDDDFLTVRLGLGTVPFEVDIDYPQEQFSMEEDVEKNIVQDFADEARVITGAPITVSLLEKRISGIVGNYDLTSDFARGILLQLITYYSGDLLKIAIFTSEKNSANWNDFKTLQHLWTNDKTERFYATNSEEVKDVIKFLEKEYSAREEIFKDKDTSTEESPHKKFDSYYLILTDDFKAIRDNNFIKKLLKADSNYGFSLLIINDKLSNLPNECTGFININKDSSSGLIENDLSTSSQKEFVAEFSSNIDISACCSTLANIPLLIETNSKGLPDSCDFMELYSVGKVEQLNSQSRWKTNDPTISLAAPVGIDTNGDDFKIDLHEKFHGPHGLVAGTTGSGKSEWIITFILSMAINYSPEEVSFVLIDYKGGGLALAFENKELGVKLPHIAGTITNLDVNELNRSLASIEAELKRRQREFNKARDISGESTIDIYKYQRLYRDGVVEKPISHLFLISDEFAELKSQQPEFMDQLISTARIGRSLGVHLILATQKPSGVVNDQIWSNSRFKVCLKVQDKADSNEMIRVPDAAEIKQPGRFFLLVGYDDYFAMGQSAYCGMPYFPSEKVVKKIDTSLNFVNNVGYTIKRIDEIKKVDTSEKHGEVLLNVVKYLSGVAAKEKIQISPLWLERIPNVIYVDNLKKKYNYQKKAYIINPVIGEYDNPSNQSQHLLTLNLSGGNSAIYGVAGSGKEDFLATLIYSCCTSYTTNEINIYIIDCGAETLTVYKNLPQVGDVALVNDTEKIVNLFKKVNEIIKERKKMFSEYGGNIASYNAYNEVKQNTIVIIINAFEVFVENYESLEGLLVSITRDCVKYGIIFVLSVATANGVRYRLKSNFANCLSLQMTDSMDYMNIIGVRTKMAPSNNKGRGLVNIDGCYEFQTASICEPANLLNFIKKLGEVLLATNPKAPVIPVLPEEVTINEVSTEIKTIENVPVGISKNDLNICTFDFKESIISQICASDLMITKSFINGIMQVISMLPKTKIVILDSAKISEIPLTNDVLKYFNNYTEAITELDNFNAVMKQTLNQSNGDVNALTQYKDIYVVILGFADILDKLEDKTVFQNIMDGAKENGKVHFILCDSSDSLKTLQYETWYKTNVNSKNGIWIGNDISSQSIIKISRMGRELSNPIGNDFGYVITNGDYKLIKLLKYVPNETEEVEELDL